MQGKKTANPEQSQSGKKIKSIKVLHSCSHADRPKISLEGKWLEQLGFYIGDKLQISYGNKFIYISHAADDNQINETVSAYMAETGNTPGTEQNGTCRELENMKSRKIKVTSSIHMRQTAGDGGPLYYPKCSKISMEGKWLEKAGFFTGNRIQVEYQENSICMYPAV